LCVDDGSGAEGVSVVDRQGIALVGVDHVLDAIRADSVRVNLVGIDDIDNVELTLSSGGIEFLAIGAPNVEERVEARSVDPHLGAILDRQTIRHVTPVVSCAEVGVSRMVGSEGSVLGGLVVGGLGLDASHENVVGSVEVVLVQDGMLHSGSVEPYGTLGLAEETAGVIYVDLGALVNVVIGCPSPHVFGIQIATHGDVEQRPRAIALGSGGIGSIVGRAVVGLDVGSDRSSNSVMHVPNSIGSWGIGGVM